MIPIIFFFDLLTLEIYISTSRQEILFNSILIEIFLDTLHLLKFLSIQFYLIACYLVNSSVCQSIYHPKNNNSSNFPFSIKLIHPMAGSKSI